MNKRINILIIALGVMFSFLSVYAQNQTYIALGDSVAFGITDETALILSNGDRGYAKLYADWLETQNNGERPKLINLAAGFETSITFYEPNPLNVLQNTNYPSLISQFDLFKAHVAAEQGSGNTIKAISIQLGANDLTSVVNAPDFASLPFLEQFARINQAFASLQTNYSHLLSWINLNVPGADVMVMGYYNPFGHYPPTDQRAAIYRELVLAGNDLLSNVAAQNSARFVDVYPAFVGHELEYTYIGSPYPDNSLNSHPTPLGYQVMFNQMVVPEPGTIAALAILLGNCGWKLRRKS